MDKIAKEYRKLKEDHPEEILLYQVGIFYRIMFEDAGKAAAATGLKLLMQGEVSEPYEICGFPTSGLDKYVGKLARAGFSAAICNQEKDEDGQIRREVVEFVRLSKNRTEQNRTEQNRTEQNRTEQNRTEQNRTEQNRTEQNRTEQG